MTTTAAAGVRRVAEPPERPAAGHVGQVKVPAGTTTLFALLVTAVLASSLVISATVYWSLPSKGGHLGETWARCQEKEPVLALPSATPNDVYWHAEAWKRYGLCTAPAYRDLASWAAYEVTLVFGVAGILYWAYPVFLVRRHRLARFREDDGPELAAELAALSKQAGLARTPEFYVSPKATVNGQVFGRPRRPCVRLDAGLVALRGTPRAAEFRAVVLHELAHLRTNDVGRTYLTITICWSFAALALLPGVLVTVHPTLLSEPLRWSIADLASWGRLRTGLALLALTAVVALTGAAVLRVRETQADARAAAWVADPGDASALRGLVERLPAPSGYRWRAVLSLHPRRAARLRAIDNPEEEVLLRPRLWELVGGGGALGIIAANLDSILLYAMPVQSQLRVAVPGLVCAPAAAGLLGVAVWRAVARAGRHRPPLRALALPVVALAVGFLAGEYLAWSSPQASSSSQARLTTPSGLAAVAVLLAGGLLLAVWLASAMRLVLASTRGSRRWALPAVVATGAGVVTLLFAVWFKYRASGSFDDVSFGIPDERSDLPGASIGWYRTLARWADFSYAPLQGLFYNPLTLPALALLWLVPLVLTRRPRHGTAASPRPASLRPALLAALIGGGAYTLVCVGLTYVGKALLPISVREHVGFTGVAGQTWTAAAVLAQAGVAAAVAALTRHHRAVLVPFAVFLTGMLSAAALVLVVVPHAVCADMYGTADRYGAACLVHYYGPADAALFTHWAMVKGVVAAVPAALLGAAVAAAITRLRHRRLGAGTVPEPVRAGRRSELARTAPAAATAVLLAATTTAATFQAPNAAPAWLVADILPTPAFPAAWPALMPPCVLGTWAETSHSSHERVDGTEVRWAGEGRIYRFAADGTGVVDFGAGNVETATAGGHAWERTTTGMITFRYETRLPAILFTSQAATGASTVTVDGDARHSRLLQADLEPVRLSCENKGTMTLYGSGEWIELRRTGSTAPYGNTGTPATSASPDPCVVGTWMETSSFASYRDVGWAGGGAVHYFRADGTGDIDYGTGAVRTAHVKGPAWKLTTSGKVTFNYATRDGKIYYSDVSANGTTILEVDHAVRHRDSLVGYTGPPESYLCQDDMMIRVGDSRRVNLSRE